MKSTKMLFALFSLIMVVSLSACFGTPAQPTIDYQALINTSVAQTEAAKGPVATTAPGNVPTAECVLPTATLAFTNTPLPTFTPFATLKPTSVPCYSMGFVKDITIPDGTKMTAGETFTKTWRLQNTGTCTWTTSYFLRFDSGNQMNADMHTPFPKSVAPGALVDISVKMTAPSTAGTYVGNYKIKAADGTIFGAGAGSVPIFVKIVVTGPEFAVTKVSNFTVTPNCGSPSVVFTADVKTNAAGRVDAHWIFDNNGTLSNGPSNHVDFSSATTKTFTATWDLSGLGFTGPGSASLYIDSPNHQLFGPSATFICP
jgi:Ig-like domain from next to BRCA1 gene